MKLISRKITISSIKYVLFLYYSNKIKQEKWLDEKTRRIKEQTVRGLEPEIQRLLARHNAELADMDAERERRLSAQERELHQKHLQHIRELRAHWEEENAEGWIHERQLLTTRYVRTGCPIWIRLI